MYCKGLNPLQINSKAPLMEGSEAKRSAVPPARTGRWFHTSLPRKGHEKVPENTFCFLTQKDVQHLPLDSYQEKADGTLEASYSWPGVSI